MRAKKKRENFQNCYKNLFSAGQLLWVGVSKFGSVRFLSKKLTKIKI